MGGRIEEEEERETKKGRGKCEGESKRKEGGRKEEGIKRKEKGVLRMAEKLDEINGCRFPAYPPTSFRRFVISHLRLI